MEKLLSFSLILTVLIVLNACFVQSQTIYDEQDNPNIWPGLCQNGQKQTPIDIVESQATYFDPIPMTLTYSEYDKPIGDIELENDGKSVHVTFSNPNFNPSIRFRGQKYILLQFHFHWGHSEHALNGKLYDGEIHLVHQDPKNDTNLLVLGAFLKKTNSSDNIISNIFRESVKNIRNYNETFVLNLDQNLRRLLQRVNLRTYFSYEGSLTTPDCDQGVRWIVFRDRIEVDSKAIEDLKQLKNDKGANLLFTNRKLQPVNGRKVYKTFIPIRK